VRKENVLEEAAQEARVGVNNDQGNKVKHQKETK